VTARKKQRKRQLRAEFRRAFGHRLDMALNIEGLSQIALGRLLDSGSGDVCRWVHGQTEPGVWVVSRLEELLPTINILWLLTGKGNILKS